METKEAKSLAKNSLWLALGEAVNGILMFFLTVLLARYLMAEGYGKLMFSLSLVNLFTIFSDLGLGVLTVRELAKNKKDVKKYLSNIVVIRIILAAFTLLALYITTVLLKDDQEVSNLVYLLGIWILFHSFTQFFASVFRAFEKMMYESLVRIIYAIILTFSILVFINQNYGLFWIGLSYCLAGFVSVILSVFFIWFKFSKFTLGFDIIFWKKTLNKSWPFALSALFILIYYYLDSVMLEFMGKYEDVGWYNAAYKPIMFIILLSSVLSRSAFPIMSRYYKESLEKLSKFLNNYFKLNIFIALPLAFGGTILAYPIINLVYGSDFDKSALAFQILIWTVFVIFINTTFGQALQAANKQKTHLLGVGIGAGINIILNILLIPKYSLYGAAVATLTTEIVVLLFMYYKYSQIARVKILKNIIRPFISSLIMFLVLYFLNLNLFIMIFLGIAIYFVCMFIIRGFSSKDINLLKDILTKKELD